MSRFVYSEEKIKKKAAEGLAEDIELDKILPDIELLKDVPFELLPYTIDTFHIEESMDDSHFYITNHQAVNGKKDRDPRYQDVPLVMRISNIDKDDFMRQYCQFSSTPLGRQAYMNKFVVGFYRDTQNVFKLNHVTDAGMSFYMEARGKQPDLFNSEDLMTSKSFLKVEDANESSIVSHRPYQRMMHYMAGYNEWYGFFFIWTHHLAFGALINALPYLAKLRKCATESFTSIVDPSYEKEFRSNMELREPMKLPTVNSVCPEALELLSVIFERNFSSDARFSVFNSEEERIEKFKQIANCLKNDYTNVNYDVIAVETKQIHSDFVREYKPRGILFRPKVPKLFSHYLKPYMAQFNCFRLDALLILLANLKQTESEPSTLDGFFKYERADAYSRWKASSPETLKHTEESFIRMLEFEVICYGIIIANSKENKEIFVNQIFYLGVLLRRIMQLWEGCNKGRVLAHYATITAARLTINDKDRLLKHTVWKNAFNLQLYFDYYLAMFEPLKTAIHPITQEVMSTKKQFLYLMGCSEGNVDKILGLTDESVTSDYKEGAIQIDSCDPSKNPKFACLHVLEKLRVYFMLHNISLRDPDSVKGFVLNHLYPLIFMSHMVLSVEPECTKEELEDGTRLRQGYMEEIQNHFFTMFNDMIYNTSHTKLKYHLCKAYEQKWFQVLPEKCDEMFAQNMKLYVQSKGDWQKVFDKRQKENEILDKVEDVNKVTNQLNEMKLAEDVRMSKTPSIKPSASNEDPDHSDDEENNLNDVKMKTEEKIEQKKPTGLAGLFERVISIFRSNTKLNNELEKYKPNVVDVKLTASDAEGSNKKIQNDKDRMWDFFGVVDGDDKNLKEMLDSYSLSETKKTN